MAQALAAVAGDKPVTILTATSGIPVLPSHTPFTA